ncbi:unnamed protein product [Adineta ricciae]|uniref:Uncharacterized protein n=1 Tax=Adineta ricciae TaxID=249248 RepID=A0A815MC63_ADIRI|nr:unnamed protein product [Adineta ricciae]
MDYSQKKQSWLEFINESMGNNSHNTSNHETQMNHRNHALVDCDSGAANHTDSHQNNRVHQIRSDEKLKSTPASLEMNNGKKMRFLSRKNVF